MLSHPDWLQTAFWNNATFHLWLTHDNHNVTRDKITRPGSTRRRCLLSECLEQVEPMEQTAFDKFCLATGAALLVTLDDRIFFFLVFLLLAFTATALFQSFTSDFPQFFREWRPASGKCVHLSKCQWDDSCRCCCSCQSREAEIQDCKPHAPGANSRQWGNPCEKRAFWPTLPSRSVSTRQPKGGMQIASQQILCFRTKQNSAGVKTFFFFSVCSKFEKWNVKSLWLSKFYSFAGEICSGSQTVTCS